MAVYPTPTGAPQITSAMTGYTESYFRSLFTKQWGSAAGSAYATLNTNNPQNSPYTNAQIFTDYIVAQGVAKGIASVVSLEGAIPGAAATGAENATKTLTTGPLSGLAAIGALANKLSSLGNTRPFMVRAVKVIVGVGLIITGLTMLVKKETNISLGDVAKVAAI